MEGVTVIGVALDNFLDLAVNLHFDYILSAQRNRRAQDLLQDEETRSALRAWRPRIDDVRSACMLLADQHERLWTSPQQQLFRELLRDPVFIRIFPNGCM